MNILFVCTGNINRSPAAQIIMKSLSPEDNIDSAAISNYNKGKLTTKKMRGALQRNGYKYFEIRSKPITQNLVDWADIILYMQPSHLEDLVKMFGLSKKYFNLSYFISKTKIHDPVFNKDSSKYDEVVLDITKACNNLLAQKAQFLPLKPPRMRQDVRS